MGKHRWTEEENYYFIVLYKNHECLWNTKSAAYLNNRVREAAFADIEAKMLKYLKVDEFGPDKVKLKMCNIRANYNQIKKRYKYSSFCPSEQVGKWYKEMDYIVQHTRLNKTSHDNSNANDNSRTMCQDREVAVSSTNPEPEINQQKKIPQQEMTQPDTGTYPAADLVKIQSRIEIMNVLKKLYKEKVAPTYAIMFDILTKIIQNNDTCLTHDVERFKYEMTKLGYFYKETIDGKRIIVENAEQRFERYLYLTKIKKIRGEFNRQIIYLDERIINSQLRFKKINNLNNGLPPDSSIFFHAITREEYFKGLCSNQATVEDFNKWVTGILLCHLRDPSVIVMDNGPLHGALEDTCPITRYNTKNEMVKWLNNNNIPCSPAMSRPELFELIRKNKRNTKEYKIDKILRSHGHEVLRLPNNFPDLNLTDIFWDTVYEGNSSNIILKTTPPPPLPVLQNKILDNILPSIPSRNWSNFEQLLIMKENYIFEIDNAMENILETYVFK